MKLTTFYPGPSQLYPQVEGYLLDAYQSGVLSMNHRSGAFMDMLGRTIAEIRSKLDIPADYEIYFTSSATECWEIISQSLVQTSSHHAFNGAFGQKWFEYAGRLHPAFSHPFELNQDLNTWRIEQRENAEMLCLTHNETSNGTAIPTQSLQKIRRRFEGLIAIDATSSMAGVALPWSMGDVWFASVQKCFGLPSGLGVLVVSARAVARAEEIGERNHYNSLLFIRDNFLKNQTPYTPNILGIYLLGQVMAQVPPIEVVDRNVGERAKAFYSLLEGSSYELLVNNPEVRSATVLAIQGSEDFIGKIKEKAVKQGMLLGNGYGDRKTTTVRIANFPAIPDTDFVQLRDFLLKYH